MVAECLRWGVFAAVVVPAALLLTGGSTRTAAISGAATAGLTGLIFVLTRLARLRLPYLDRTEAPPELDAEPVGEFRVSEERWQPPVLPSPLAPGTGGRGFVHSYAEDRGYYPPLEPQLYGAPRYEPSRYDHVPYEPALSSSAAYEPDPFQPAPYELNPYEPSSYEPAAYDLRHEAEYDPRAYGPAPYDPPAYEPAPNGTWPTHDVAAPYPPELPDRWATAAGWDPFPAQDDAPPFTEDPRLSLRRDNGRRSRRRAP